LFVEWNAWSKDLLPLPQAELESVKDATIAAP
jgi:hypothetical protein